MMPAVASAASVAMISSALVPLVSVRMMPLGVDPVLRVWSGRWVPDCMLAVLWRLLPGYVLTLASMTIGLRGVREVLRSPIGGRVKR